MSVALLDNALSRQIIGAAIEVHRVLRPALLESAYEAAICRELEIREVPFRRQLCIPMSYKGIDLEVGYRIDSLVQDEVVVEIKAVEHLLPVHEAQLLTYLRLLNKRLGLLINFHFPVLREGIRRLIL